MSSLYQLTGKFLELREKLFDPECDEQLINDSLECLDCSIEEKADNIAKLKRELEGKVDEIDVEIKRLQARKIMLTNRKERVVNYLMASMRAIGKTKFETALNSFGIRKAGGKQPLVIDFENPADIPEDYRKVVKYGADNDKIREDLDKGIELEWARYAERTEYLSIK